MTDYELTNLARIPLLMLEYAEQFGIDRGELLRLASITPATLADPDTSFLAHDPRVDDPLRRPPFRDIWFELRPLPSPGPRCGRGPGQ